MTVTSTETSCKKVTRQFPLYAISYTYIYSKSNNTVTTKHTYNINNITQLHSTAEENTALYCTAYTTTTTPNTAERHYSRDPW